MDWIRRAASFGLLWAIACGDAEARVEPEPATAGSAAVEVRESMSGSGAVVRFRPQPDPPVPGPVRLYFSVHDSSGRAPRSVDLVSPGMPMHGVTRRDVTAAGEAWIADIEVPMAGEWSIYLNFDDGTDAVEFRFAVGEASSSSQSHTHGHSHSEEETT
ncbi:MAG: hypothetical protein L0271_06560 [Gemmatimonadetes bacterium]|nr:hypothetical protein [Gemmatimonadota bacterium]